jgi:hypothetical protein
MTMSERITYKLWRHSIVLLNTTLIIACGQRSGAPVDSHPTELTGRWVRQLDNGVWRDTIDFRPDGHVGGSLDNAVPPSARWGVSTRNGMRVFCARDSVESSCQSYHIAGDILTLSGGPSQVTTYRRVP